MIDAVNSSVLEVLRDVYRHLTENNHLFIKSVKTESEKENWKEISQKRKAKATFATIPNKFQPKHQYSKRVGTVIACFGLPQNESCYDVIEMRNYLSSCLQLQELSPFLKISIKEGFTV